MPLPALQDLVICSHVYRYICTCSHHSGQTDVEKKLKESLDRCKFSLRIQKCTCASEYLDIEAEPPMFIWFHPDQNNAVVCDQVPIRLGKTQSYSHVQCVNIVAYNHKGRI